MLSSLPPCASSPLLLFQCQDCSVLWDFNCDIETICIHCHMVPQAANGKWVEFLTNQSSQCGVAAGQLAGECHLYWRHVWDASATISETWWTPAGDLQITGPWNDMPQHYYFCHSDFAQRKSLNTFLKGILTQIKLNISFLISHYLLFLWRKLASVKPKDVKSRSSFF